MANSDKINRALALLENAFNQVVLEFGDDEEFEGEGLTTEEVTMAIRELLQGYQYGENDINVSRVGHVDGSSGMNYINIDLQDGSEYQVQVHLKARPRQMETVAENVDAREWQMAVANVAMSYEGIDALYSEDDMLDFVSGLDSRGEINVSMDAEEAGTKVAQMILQA
jgi:hypothetical protein